MSEFVEIDLDEIFNEVGNKTFEMYCDEFFGIPETSNSPFFKNSSLKAVKFCRTKTSPLTIGRYFLFECRNLEVVDFSGVENIVKIDTGFLANCYMLKHVKNVQFNKVQQIGDGFMNMCLELESIDLTSFCELEVIGYCFLHNCRKLKNLSLSSFGRVKKIGYNFLFNCMSLKSIDLSPLTQVESVGDRFMLHCYQLELKSENDVIQQAIENTLKSQTEFKKLEAKNS
jgi:hypothetical protein